MLALAFAAGATYLNGGFESAAALGGGLIGGAIGILAGFGGGLWLVLRKGGYWGGTAVACLAIGAILMLLSLAYLAVS